MGVVLSILVVSHNQCGLLPRCLDSVLSQKLNVSYEVIVSDDRSTDGTWELIEDYMRRYPGIVKGVHCNSDECNPINRSERCGWNKATAYKNCEGDFFVNIDADDYLKSDDIYQLQLDMLMLHPDCYLCQQKVWQVNDGDPLEKGYAWPNDEWLKEGMILTPKEVVCYDMRGVNTTYMIRRNKDVDPVGLYGKHFDDSVITLHHLQYGNVVLIDRADYVWVQYKNSISNSVRGDVLMVERSLLPFTHAMYIPKFRDLFLERMNLDLYHLLRRCVVGGLELNDEQKAYWGQHKGFIFQFVVGRKKGLLARLRVARAFLICRKNRKKGSSKQEINRLYNLLVG